MHRSWMAMPFVILPFVADTYGVLRADARSLLLLSWRKASTSRKGKSVWQSISAAAVSRAARQLALEQNAISAGRGLLLQGHGHGQSSNNMQLSPGPAEAVVSRPSADVDSNMGQETAREIPITEARRPDPRPVVGRRSEAASSSRPYPGGLGHAAGDPATPSE